MGPSALAVLAPYVHAEAARADRTDAVERARGGGGHVDGRAAAEEEEEVGADHGEDHPHVGEILTGHAPAVSDGCCSCCCVVALLVFQVVVVALDQRVGVDGGATKDCGAKDVVPKEAELPPRSSPRHREVVEQPAAAVPLARAAAAPAAVPAPSLPADAAEGDEQGRDLRPQEQDRHDEERAVHAADDPQDRLAAEKVLDRFRRLVRLLPPRVRRRRLERREKGAAAAECRRLVVTRQPDAGP
mmetsp:Transcript_33930/g.108967  ORF Transcript_33930/g.108967 Transcript_33930/m.108967 type:complete len:244 (-) Transcript_33930:207-938(-)